MPTSHSCYLDIEQVISNLIVSGSLFITIDMKTGPYCLVSVSRDFKFLTVDSTLSSNCLLFYFVNVVDWRYGKQLVYVRSH